MPSEVLGNTSGNCGRLLWLDIAKGVAIFAVVLGHTYSFGNPIHAFTYSFHIPLFFLLAGVTFKIKPFKTVLSGSAKRLLLPYVLLCLYSGVVLVVSGGPTLDALKLFTLTALFAAGGTVESLGVPGVGLAWFLMALFVARLVLWVTLRLIGSHGSKCVLSVLILFFMACLAAYVSAFSLLPFAFLQGVVGAFFASVGYAVRETRFIDFLTKWYSVLLAAIVWMSLLLCGVFFSIGNMFFISPFFVGVLMSLTASVVMVKICMLIEKCDLLSRALSFVGGQFHAFALSAPI